MCAVLLLPNCRDAFLRLGQLTSLRDRQFHSAPLACRDVARHVSTVRGILFRLLAFLFVETWRVASPSLTFLLAETQECVSICFRRTLVLYGFSGGATLAPWRWRGRKRRGAPRLYNLFGGGGALSPRGYSSPLAPEPPSPLPPGWVCPPPEPCWLSSSEPSSVTGPLAFW